MILFKAKANETTPGVKTQLKGNVGKGYGVRIEAIYYSSINPGNFLHLLDADGDEFMFAIPGQGIQKTISPAIPVTVKLPLSYLDISQGGYEIIIWGVAEKVTAIEASI